MKLRVKSLTLYVDHNRTLLIYLFIYYNNEWEGTLAWTGAFGFVYSHF